MIIGNYNHFDKPIVSNFLINCALIIPITMPATVPVINKTGKYPTISFVEVTKQAVIIWPILWQTPPITLTVIVDNQFVFLSNAITNKLKIPPARLYNKL